MICKSITHTDNVNYRTFIEYILDDEKKLDPADNWVIVENADYTSSNIDGLVSQFKKYEKLKPKRKNATTKILHLVLSASPGSPVNADIMYDLTRELLGLYNTKGGIAVASYHSDKKHKHVHIMLSGGNAEGKSTRVSRKEFFEIRKQCELYQIEKYPEIKDIVYLPEYKKDKDKQPSKFKSDAEYNLEKRGHGSDKNMLKDLLHSSFEKADNLTHLYSILQSKEGLKVYDYRGKPTGLVYNNRKYRFKKLIDTPELQNKFLILERLEELSKLHKPLEREGLER